MEGKRYYDGTKLLSLMDSEGNKPEIYICTSNRTAGKTTYWGRYCVNRWLKYGEKFMLLYRNSGELDGNIADKFFKDIGYLFFKDYVMTSKKTKEGYCELLLNDIVCGYAVALRNADKVKKCSHLFSDVQRMLFDEFMSETNSYLPDEVTKFRSVHTSVARGQGAMTRYVPVIMVSNPVTLINPYYIALGISNRLRANTKFLRGEGWVLEQGYNEEASKAQLESGFNKAFGSDSQYMAYSAQGAYLNDSFAFVSRPEGENKYIATLKYKGESYAIREYPELGILYCDDRYDASCPFKISVTTADHDVNYVMLRRNDLFIDNMKYYFNKGCFRFKNLRCKDVIFAMLAYK